MPAHAEMQPPIFLEKWIKSKFDLNESVRAVEDRRNRDVGYFLRLARSLTGNYTDKYHDKVGIVSAIKTLPIKVVIGSQCFKLAVWYFDRSHALEKCEDAQLVVMEDGSTSEYTLFSATCSLPAGVRSDICSASNFFGGIATPVDIELACQVLEEMNKNFAVSTRQMRAETLQVAK